MTEYKLTHCNGQWTVSNSERETRVVVVNLDEETHGWTSQRSHLGERTGQPRQHGTWQSAILHAIEIVTPGI